MKSFKYLHLMHNEKFIAPFIAFIKDHFNFDEHFFILAGGVPENVAKIPQYENVLYLDSSYNSKWNYFKLSKIYKQYTKDAKKIILHSLIEDRNILFLFLNQNLLSKSYWLLWGADLYTYKMSKRNLRWRIREQIRKKIIKNIFCITTTVPGDYDLAKKWYKTNAKYIENLMYPSHIARNLPKSLVSDELDGIVNIQIGNSADSSNNHLDIFDKLIKYKNENIKIFVPLSYGNQEYAKKVIIKGKESFGNKFIPLTHFMTFDKYNKYMSSIDIAIFNHDRQQGMGNIIGLISLGKKVYLRSTVTPYRYFMDLGLTIFDSSEYITLDKINNNEAISNMEIASSFFSYETLIKNWKMTFDE